MCPNEQGVTKAVGPSIERTVCAFSLRMCRALIGWFLMTFDILCFGEKPHVTSSVESIKVQLLAVVHR